MVFFSLIILPRVVTGGTNSGVMKLVGEIFSSQGVIVPLLGVGKQDQGPNQAHMHLHICIQTCIPNTTPHHSSKYIHSAIAILIE